MHVSPFAGFHVFLTTPSQFDHPSLLSGVVGDAICPGADGTSRKPSGPDSWNGIRRMAKRLESVQATGMVSLAAASSLFGGPGRTLFADLFRARNFYPPSGDHGRDQSHGIGRIFRQQSLAAVNNLARRHRMVVAHVASDTQYT